MNRYEKLFNSEIVVLDGAMGTMLQKHGLKTGESSELFCMTHPNIVEQIHRYYLESGSRVIYTNTLTANRPNLEGTGFTVSEVITRGVEIAHRAAEEYDACVALDLGALNEMLEPAGDLTFEDAYEIFKEQVIAGEQAGADLVVFETMFDLHMVKAAVLAAKENTSLPIFVTMTFNADGRTFVGCSVKAMAYTLEGLGVDAIGINCSLGPKEIFPIAKELSEVTNLPLIIKANAGLPDSTGKYNVTADEFSELMLTYKDLGIKFIGGCCGTDPEYIKGLVQTFEGVELPKLPYRAISGVCTPLNVVDFDRIRVVGENINPTGKDLFQQALLSSDIGYIERQAIQQAEAGADILDINVGMPGIDEVNMMTEVVKCLQSAVPLPLQIDSSKPKVIEAALRIYNGKAIVNSVNGKQKVLDTILPIVKKYGAAVIGLTLDENGIPDSADGRLKIAKKILDSALKHGIRKEDIIIDPLVLTVSAQQEGALTTLAATKLIKEKLGLKTVLGISNISYGLPNRDIVNRNFLTLAMANGLDLAIVNPTVPGLIDSVYAHNVLFGFDKSSAEYLLRYGNVAEATDNKVATAAPDKLFKAVLNGSEDEAVAITAELLKSSTELQIIDTILIPALDEVGRLYEAGDYFLPQLLRSSTTACRAFDVLNESISNSGEQKISKGNILLATVQGDIHDIGKNIAKVLLENYGYTVTDLGRDVPIETVVEQAISGNYKLVGLSALMTTTAENLKLTIDALRHSGASCKVMVGGAVITQDYADKIRADFYAKDAKAGVDIAKQVFN